MSQVDYPSFQGFDQSGGFHLKDWNEFWNSLTEDQQQRVKDKASWEGCTLSAVFYDWPSILEGVE